MVPHVRFCPQSKLQSLYFSIALALSHPASLTRGKNISANPSMSSPSDMSYNNLNGTSGIGGVRNLRAIFETSEQSTVSPPSRGRSPAHSEASIHSRPVSKVRASFVVVERSGDIEDGQHWGLRKISNVTAMADIKQELEHTPVVNGASNTHESEPNGVHDEPGPQPLLQQAAHDTTQWGLGSILKGSEFETSPPGSRAQAEPSGASQGPQSPTSPKKGLTASRANEKGTPRSPSKSIGSKVKDAVSPNHNKPPPPTKFNTTKEARPTKPLPTRQVPAARVSPKSPTSPRTSRAPVSPSTEKAMTRGSAAKPTRLLESANTEKPMTRGSAAKPMAVLQSAKHAISSQHGKKPPTVPRETRAASSQPSNLPPGRQVPSSPKTNGTKKEATAVTPESKPKSGRLPASIAAPTAASAARSGHATTLGRNPTATRREPSGVKSTTSAVSGVKKAPRRSLPGQIHGPDKTQPRTSTARKAADDGFLARMMRPTASSAQKVHEKVAPSSPPQSKRSAPVPAARGKPRTSMTTSDEDKENSHRGGQELHSSPSATEDRVVETNGSGSGSDKSESQPLNDITPAEDGEQMRVESNADALEASSA
jgi:hypothetical protein